MRKSFHNGDIEGHDTMAQTFTLILTKGMHVISADSAADIKMALAAKAATVDVLLDPFGVCSSRMTTIAVHHVVALTSNPLQEAMPANVSRIGARMRSEVR
jgi:hypothetical protein